MERTIRGIPVAAATAWIVWFGPLLLSQNRPPVTYRTEVTLAEVDAVVTDGDGRIVRDLRADDFELLEDGKPQKVDRVLFVEIPIAGGQRGPAASLPPPDVRTNMQRFAGRLYVLLLDDVQTSPPRAGRVRESARRFVTDNLEPGDLAAVVHASGLGAANQDFTSEARLLLASIDRFQGRKTRSETLNLVDEYNRRLTLTDRANPAPMRDPDEGSRVHDARTAFDVITGIGRRLAGVRGRRKALLWFGEGVAYDMFDLSRRQAPFVLESARAAVAAATRANLVIYGIDARGLAGLGEETMALSRPALDPASPLGASGLQQELRQSQDHLRKIATDTGGFAVVNTDEFSGAFDRVVLENSAYYLLGYYPVNSAADGTYRRLEVRVRRPGVRVRARAGYLAVRSTAPDSAEPESLRNAEPALRDALASPVPQSGLQMATHAAAFKGTRGKASVLLTVEYAAAAFDAPATDAPAGDRLQTSVVAIDALGRIEASDHVSIGFDVKPQTRQAMKVLGFRTHSRLDLPPGRYQLRVAAVRPNGLAGSVHHDIEVPDFTASALTMSDLVLTSVVAGLVPTAHLDDRMRQVLPAPPSTMRDIRQDESIALFAETYEDGRVPSRAVELSTTVRNARGEVVFSRTDRSTPDRLEESGGGYSLHVPMRDLPPGNYSLHLEAAFSGGTAPIAREAAFRVWAVPEHSFVVVARGAMSGVAEPKEVVARNEEEWHALWSSLSLRTPAPDVAFANTMIAAVFLGTRPTAGYQPELVALRREADALVIQWRERVPPDAGNAPDETTPFLIAGVPMHAGPVRFERTP